jgi:hypothetical protein
MQGYYLKSLMNRESKQELLCDFSMYFVHFFKILVQYFCTPPPQTLFCGCVCLCELVLPLRWNWTTALSTLDHFAQMHHLLIFVSSCPLPATLMTKLQYTPQKDKLGISRVLLVKIVPNYHRLSSSSVVPLGVFEKNRTSWDFLILKTSKYHENLHWNLGYGPGWY